MSIYTTRDQIEDRVTDQRTGTKSEEVKKKKKNNEKEQTAYVIYGTPTTVQILD